MHERGRNIQLSGRGISAGLGIGTAHICHDVLQRVDSAHCLRSDHDVDEACQRLERATDKVLADLEWGEKDVNRILDVTDYFLQDHRAIFRLLENTVMATGDKPYAVCGEPAGRPDAISRLLSFGIRELSVNPIQTPRVKQSIREVDLQADEAPERQRPCNAEITIDKAYPRGPPSDCRRQQYQTSAN